MIHKVVLFRNLVDNIPKNIGLYSVGILFLVISGYSFDIMDMTSGLVAFIISYSAVYVFNDIFDVSEDERDLLKRTRKPLVQGSVDRSEAVIICLVLLIVGLMLSLLQNWMFFVVVSILIIINALYSIPLTSLTTIRGIMSKSGVKTQELDTLQRISFKHTIAALPLVFAMQFLKILLPWTITPQLAQFPLLFGIGFSLFYVVFFKGYKANQTIGESVIHEPLLFSTAVSIFILSMLVHQGPILQASIFLYLLAGIALFRNFHFIDRKLLFLSPIYIAIGVVFFFWLILFI